VKLTINLEIARIMYVNMQTVLPSKFGESGVTWVSFGFSFFCVNRITCFKVSNAAYCFTCMWQIKYNFYFSIALFVCLFITLRNEKVKWPKEEHVVPRVPSCCTLVQNSKEGENEE
jgi:hypothetical protein